MTAASAYPSSPSETAEVRSSEPSMEDILASIRRIIADDQNQGGKAGNGVRRQPANGQNGSAEAERGATRARTPYDDVLDLARLVPPVERDGSNGSPPGSHASSAAPSIEHGSYPAGDGAGYHAESHQEDSGHVSGQRARTPEFTDRDAAQEEDHDMLDHTLPAVSDDGEDGLLSAPLGASVMSAFEALAATVVLQNTPMLERVMRDLLRPMLKTWLDDNLPSLVERLVRTEIERVARGSRG